MHIFPAIVSLAKNTAGATRWARLIGDASEDAAALMKSMKVTTMETPAFFTAVFLWCLLISVTGYSIYMGFGPPSKELRDPFEEHED